jgi:hypothetical protein
VGDFSTSPWTSGNGMNPPRLSALGSRVPGIRLIKQLLGIRRSLLKARRSRNQRVPTQVRTGQELLISQLLSLPRYADPKRLNRYEAQVFSQNGEDGIISEIFSRLGTTNRIFVECGASDGTENNCAYLLLKGWGGFWFDGDESSVESLNQRFSSQIREQRLIAGQGFFNAESAPLILHKHRVPLEFDILSLDIDRNTSWAWQALREFRPRVVVIEYNASIPPQDDWEISYDPHAVWDGTVVFGASLLALQRIGEDMGYALVGCELAGVNAFFVRKDLTKDLFCEPFTAVNHYEPPRYFLVRVWGHPSFR